MSRKDAEHAKNQKGDQETFACFAPCETIFFPRVLMERFATPPKSRALEFPPGPDGVSLRAWLPNVLAHIGASEGAFSVPPLHAGPNPSPPPPLRAGQTPPAGLRRAPGLRDRKTD